MEFRLDPPSIAGMPIPSTVFRCCEAGYVEVDLSFLTAGSWTTFIPEFLEAKEGAWNEVDDDLRKNGNEVVVPRLDVLEPVAIGRTYPS
jgi:hypothetical protein